MTSIYLLLPLFLLLTILPTLTFSLLTPSIPNADFLKRVTNLDDKVRTSFSSISSESTALYTITNLTHVIQSYASIHYFQRALALLEVSKPPALPSQYYNWKLAPYEANMYACYDDYNQALLVMHRSRDNLLKYLGERISKNDLKHYTDVYSTIFSMTSMLIVWYIRVDSFEGASKLGDWMVDNGPYRSKYQLPFQYQPELLMVGPYPEFEEFGLDGIKGFLEGKREVLIGEVEGDEIRMRHNVDCRVRQNATKEETNYWKQMLVVREDCEAVAVKETCEDEDGEKTIDDDPPPTELCNLFSSLEKNHVKKVHKISLNTISRRTSIYAHFGESNIYLTLLMGLSKSKDLNGEETKDNVNADSCFTTKVHDEERNLTLSEGGVNNVVLIDDSFLTEFVNVCEEEFSFLRVDFVHPHFQEGE